MNLKTGHRFEIFETIFLAINILTWRQRTFLPKWSDGVCQSKSEIRWWSPPWRLANNKLRWIQCRPPKAEPYTVMKRWGPFSPWWFCDFLVEINCTCSPLHNQCQFCLPWRLWFHLLSMSRRCRALTDHQWPLRDLQIKNLRSGLWSTKYPTWSGCWSPLVRMQPERLWGDTVVQRGHVLLCSIFAAGHWCVLSFIWTRWIIGVPDLTSSATASPQQWFLPH